VQTHSEDPAAAAARRAAARPAGGALSEFARGLGFFARGFGIVWRTPRLLVLGLIPGVISAVLVFGAFLTLVYFISDLAAAVTWFADSWSAGLRGLVRFLAGAAILLGCGLLAVFTFVALTMAIGDPFYESISKRVDDASGGVPVEIEPAWYRAMWWSLVDSVRLLGVPLLVGVLAVVLGCVPVLGQVAGTVLEVAAGGWFIALEVTGVAFNRRGYRLRERRQLLRANRALALGLGVPVCLLFLIPFAAIIVMPGAVAGGTLLARRVLEQPRS